MVHCKCATPTITAESLRPVSNAKHLLLLHRRGGGIAFLLSPRVKFVLRPDLCEGKIESIWIELYPSTKRSVVLLCLLTSITA